MQKNEIRPYLKPLIKATLKWIKKDVRWESTQLLEENRGQKLHDMGLSNVRYMTSKAQTANAKINLRDCI